MITVSKAFLRIIIPGLFLYIGCTNESDSKLLGDAARINKTYALKETETKQKGQEYAYWPKTFKFGKKASKDEIAAINISIRPDGKGLPAGSGIASKGRVIFLAKCTACHGLNGTEGPQDQLVTTQKSHGKTIGNYWPYATTIFDYIRRAMPANAPGSLSNEEVYHLTAFLLHANGIIDSTKVIDAYSLPKIRMPARDLFVPDDRKGGPEIR